MSLANSPTIEPDKMRVFGMQIPQELDADLADAASRLNLTKSAVGRLALQRGLIVVLEQLDASAVQQPQGGQA